MNMTSYWAALTAPKMGVKQALEWARDAVHELAEDQGIAVNELPGEFTVDLYPNAGPGGCFSEEDEVVWEANGANEDEDPMPTVTAAKGFFYYDAARDELWHRDMSTRAWSLWNYY